MGRLSGKEKAARRATEMQERKLHEERVDDWVWIAGVGGVFIVLLSGIWIAFNEMKNNVHLVYLSVERPDEMQFVFFGGLPHLVLCSESRKALTKEGVMRETFIQAGGLLAEQNVAKIASVNCSSVLPSGKSIYERLRLNETRAPVLFLAQGGDRPIQLEPTLLRDPDAKGKKTKKRSAKAKQEDNKVAKFDKGRDLASHVKEKVSKRYSLKTITNTEDLNKQCVDRRQCALFLGLGRLSEPVHNFVARMRTNFPLLRWVYLDREKYKLNVEKEMLSAQGTPRKKLILALFRDGKFRVLNSDENFPSEYDMRIFLKEMTEMDLGEDKKLESLKTIAKVSKKKSQPKASSAKEEATMTAEEAKKLQVEKERERRKQMDEEAKEFEAISEELEDSSDEDDKFEEEQEIEI